MSQSPLIECARRVYDTERDVSFSSSSTYVSWENAFPDKPEEDVSVIGLALARPHVEKFKVVCGQFIVGMDCATIDLRKGELAEEEYYARFAQRFITAFDKHCHDVCIEAAKKLILPTSIFIVTEREPISGKITRL